MTTKDEETFDAFVRVWSVWWSGVPDALQRQEPSVVARLLMLGLRKGGISHVDVQRALQLNQPRLWKLIDKLRRAGWIRVTTSKTDRRSRFIATTAEAEKRITSLKDDLSALLRARGAKQVPAPVPRPNPAPFRRGKRIMQQPGQTGFFDNGEPL